jgi:Flp pilus assembly protein CpaB
VESILSSKLLSTRRGTIILGLVAAVLAAIALLVYLNQYRNSVNSGAQPVSVLVAKSLIQKGTPGNIVGTTALYELTKIPKKEVKTGAFVDPATLTGRVAAVDIYPGQQLTAADFVLANAAALTQNLARDQRAVVVPLDTPAEVGGQIAAGDHVDVWVLFDAQGANGVSRPLVREVLQGMYVMGVTGGNVTLRATPKIAGELIFASSNAKIWLTLRPAVGSTTTKPPEVTANDLLGLPSIRVGG